MFLEIAIPLGANRQTNRQTNRQGKNNMSPTTIVGDIKIANNDRLSFKFPEYLREKAPPLGGHVFHDIIGTLYRVLKRFFESRTIAPTDNRSYAKFDKADSRSYGVLTGRTRLSALSKHRRSDCPPLQNIVGATKRPSALSNLARDCPDTRKNTAPPGAHVFEPTGTIFELAQDIILTNLLTKFHDDGQ
ncbi:hypothetical protein DPMN_092427 [Dreissena polymorpha]|uniref:Uncharacterized protein n=1 Tax=Dreissena polymorpha TaxID=45954 RepID=A0A9D4R0Z8_DREPO|nr:hypothetical protein DPMN_092427 [Dreissena polymorpha]